MSAGRCGGLSSQVRVSVLVGADSPGLPRGDAGGREQRVRERRPRGRNSGIGGAQRGEQLDQVRPRRVAVVAGGPTHGFDQPGERRVGVAVRDLDVGRPALGVDVVWVLGRRSQHGRRIEGLDPLAQLDQGPPARGLRVPRVGCEHRVVRRAGSGQVALHQQVHGLAVGVWCRLRRALDSVVDHVLVGGRRGQATGDTVGNRDPHEFVKEPSHLRLRQRTGEQRHGLTSDDAEHHRDALNAGRAGQSLVCIDVDLRQQPAPRILDGEALQQW